MDHTLEWMGRATGRLFFLEDWGVGGEEVGGDGGRRRDREKEEVGGGGAQPINND